MSRAGASRVVGEDAQHLAGVGPDLNLAHRLGERVLAAPGLALRQQADTVRENVAVFVFGQGAFGARRQRRVGLETGDDAAAGAVQRGPPAVIVVAEVENVSGARLDRHLLRRRDVVDLRRRDRRIDRLLGVGIVDHMGLGPAGLGREIRPLRPPPAQANAGRVDQIGRLADLAPQAPMGATDHLGKQRGEQRSRAFGIGVGQRRALHGASANMVEARLVAVQTAHDLPQAPRPGKLAVKQRYQLVPTAQPPHPTVRSVRRHQTVERCPGNTLQQVVENAIVVAHGIEPPPCPKRPQTLGRQ